MVLRHPRTGESLALHDPLPAELAAVLERLRAEQGMVLLGPLPADTIFSPPVLARWARLGLLLLLGQAALGAMVGASQAALACSGWSDCFAAARSVGWDWQHLNPWQAPGPDAAAPGHPRGVWLQLLHRTWALTLMPVLAPVALYAHRHGQRSTSLALVVLLALQLLLGGLLAPAGLPLVQVLLHNLTAALVLTLLARLA